MDDVDDDDDDDDAGKKHGKEKYKFPLGTEISLIYF